MPATALLLQEFFDNLVHDLMSSKLIKNEDDFAGLRCLVVFAVVCLLCAHFAAAFRNASFLPGNKWTNVAWLNVAAGDDSEGRRVLPDISGCKFHSC